MRLHIDGIIFSLQRYGGISVYFRELMRRIPPGQTLLTLETPLQQDDMLKTIPGVQTIVRPARWLERIRACRIADADTFDVYHSTYYRRPQQIRQMSVVTVHDFVHEIFPTGPMCQMRRWLINTAISQAKHIICISQATKDDLLKFVTVRHDQRISVIHNGVADVFKPLSPSDDSDESPPFILFVGQRGGYKNFALTLAALEHLPELQLHCVGGGNFSASELEGVSANVRARVRHLGFVNDQQLNLLYNRALCLVYPSAYEGFGIPVLEAMRAGCPVVSIDCRAVIEVGGDALCISADANDPKALAYAVIRAAGSAERAQLRQRGLLRSSQFSWDQCAHDTYAVYRSLAGC